MNPRDFWYYLKQSVVEAVKAYFEPLKSPWFWAAVVLIVSAYLLWAY